MCIDLTPHEVPGEEVFQSQRGAQGRIFYQILNKTVLLSRGSAVRVVEGFEQSIRLSRTPTLEGGTLAK